MTKSTFHTGTSTILNAFSTIPESNTAGENPNHLLQNLESKWAKMTDTPKVEAAAV